METLKDILIKKTRKDHYCNSSIWISENLSLIKSGEIQLPISQRRKIIQMKNNNWKILKGNRCRYYVQIDGGEFYSGYYDDEMHKICIENDLYPEY